MHKRLGLTLFAGLAIFVSACSGGGELRFARRLGRPLGRAAAAAPSAAPSASAEARRHRRRRRPAQAKLKVGLVTDVGRINDKGFNQSAYEGMQAALAAAPTCFDTKYIETQSQSDYAKNIAEFTDAGSTS